VGLRVEEIRLAVEVDYREPSGVHCSYYPQSLIITHGNFVRKRNQVLHYARLRWRTEADIYNITVGDSRTDDVLAPGRAAGQAELPHQEPVGHGPAVAGGHEQLAAHIVAKRARRRGRGQSWPF